MRIQVKNIPLFFQLYLQLKDDILQGELMPGQALPTMEELGGRVGVSQGTILKALHLLENDGLIHRRRGLGIFVKEDVASLIIGPTWSSDMLVESISPRELHPIESGWVEAPARVRRLMAGPEDQDGQGRVFMVKRLAIDTQDARRKYLNTCFCARWAVEKLGPENLEKMGFRDALLKLCPGGRVTADEVLRPWLCDEEKGRLLGLAEGTPVVFRSLFIGQEEQSAVFYLETVATVNSIRRKSKLDLTCLEGCESAIS